jgi:hypothetical protein
MKKYRHQVNKERHLTQQPLPKGRYIGRTFRDVDGTEYEVVAVPSADWPVGSASALNPIAKLRLREWA